MHPPGEARGSPGGYGRFCTKDFSYLRFQSLGFKRRDSTSYLGRLDIERRAAHPRRRGEREPQGVDQGEPLV